MEVVYKQRGPTNQPNCAERELVAQAEMEYMIELQYCSCQLCSLQGRGAAEERLVVKEDWMDGCSLAVKDRGFFLHVPSA